MRRLNRVAHDERASAAIIVAILMTVLMGMGAIVIDVGALYQERRELQNGADAGALAVAEDCAKGDCGSPSATADPLVDSNADDGESTLDGVSVDLAAQTAKVDVSTSTADGGAQVSFSFAPILGFTGETVHASAMARWSAIDSGPALPLAISACEFDRMVGDPDSLPSGEVIITFHDGNTAEPCSGPAGQNIPGGFGWLDESDCLADPHVDPAGIWMSSNTGVSVPGGCSAADFPVGTPILFPIFDDASGTGNNGQFHVVGYSAMELSAFSLAPGGKTWTVGLTECPGATGAPAVPGTKDPATPGKDATCIVGRFVEFFEADATTGGPSTPDFGVRTVELIA